MSKINFNEAKEFLENINEKDKIVVIHHDDLDGFCSGALLLNYCLLKKAQAKDFTFSIGKSKFSEFGLEDFNKILITDLAPNTITSELELVRNKKVFYTDHHPADSKIPLEILEYRTTDLGYIPSSRTCLELTEGNPFIGLAGTIGDMGYLYPENEKFIEDNLNKIGMNFDEFKNKVSNVISNFLIYFHDEPEKAFKIFMKIKSVEEVKKFIKYSEPVENEIGKFVEEYEEKKEKIGNINFYFIEPKYKIKSVVSTIIANKNPDDILIFAATSGNKISISGRNQSKKLNMATLLKAGIKNLKNANAGGHYAASGATIRAEDLEKFKENIKIFFKNQQSSNILTK